MVCLVESQTCSVTQSCPCYANLLHHFKQFNSHRQPLCIHTLAKQGASLVAQTIKNPPVLWENQVWSLGWEDPLEKGTATHSGILAWRIPWTEEPGRLQSWGSQRVGHAWATKEQQNSNTVTDLGLVRRLASQASHPLREKALASSRKQTAVIQSLHSRQSLHPVWADFDSHLTTPCLSDFGLLI